MCSAVERLHGQACHRQHLQGGACHHHQVAGAAGALCIEPGLLRQLLAEQDHVRFKHCAAGWTARGLPFFHKRFQVGNGLYLLETLRARKRRQRSVHFDDVNRSRFLMKQVYVLSNDGMDMTFSFKLGQCSVCLVGFRIEDLTRQGAEPCIEFTRVCAEGV